MRPVTIGIVGLGYWGPNLARNFDDLSESKLTWICDADDVRRTRYSGRFGDSRPTRRFEDMLEDDELDAVVVATPVTTHYGLAKQALLAGKHVFVEKPLTTSSDEAEELVALSAEHRLVLMPGHLLLYHPGVNKLEQLIASGELGRMLYIYGNRQNLGKIRRDENALWSLGAHDLSVILHLVGDEPEDVWARGESYLTSGVEDVVFCYLRFPSGVVAHMHLSWLDPHKMRKMTVVGDQKMAVFDDMELDRKVTVYDKAAQQRADTYGEWLTRTGDIFIPRIANDEPLRIECERFIAMVRGAGAIEPVAANGLAVVRTLERLQNALDLARV